MEKTPVDAYLMHAVLTFLFAQDTKEVMYYMTIHSGNLLAFYEVQDRL